MLPSPAYPLDNSCSTLFNNTLYEFTSAAFQSLPIEHGAQWSNLSMGVPVEGGVCVKSTPINDTSAAALYIVGGTSNSSGYRGLQRYTFANQSWETLTPSVAVTQNRLYHGAVYLNTSDSILVYAGTQDGTKQLSSQTFTIQASWPYTVLAYEAIAPPAISPMLMQWSESKAVYIGGSETNTKSMIFSPSTSWVDSNATLASPIYNTSAIKAVVINGDDASKTLYTFDMTVSPNAVNRTILVDADGNPVQNAAPVVDKRWEDSSFWERSRETTKRNVLTVADWPAYNDSLAPVSTRTSYSLSKDQSGLVVISGGSTTDVLCMFKARDNCWENATSTLAAKTVSSSTDGLGSSPSPSAASASATAAATSSAAASGSSGDAAFPTKILGAVLGSILAVAFILIAFLVIFRWRKNRRQYSEAGHQRRASGIPDEKNAMDFADKGLPQMVTTRQIPGHEQQNSQGSFSSMAILMGRVGHKRGDEKNGSVGSDSSSQFNKKYKTAISKPIPQEAMQPSTQPLALPNRDEKAVSFAAKDVSAAEERDAMPRPRGSTKGGRRGSTRRSSGWNRYWSGGSSLNILGFGSKRTTYEGSDRSSDSEYSQRMPSQVTQPSALVPPLNLGERPELNRVMSGSPTIAYQSNKFPLSGEMSGQLDRTSVSTLSSYNDDRRDAFSSGIPASVHEQDAWTPVEGQGWGRASNYSESVYATTLPRSTMNYQRETRFPGPGAAPQRPPPPPSDMSWLNLGGETRI